MPSARYSHTISSTPTLIHTGILADLNSPVTDVPPFLPATIVLLNPFLFLSSSPGVAATKSISGGRAHPCCQHRSGTDYETKVRPSILALEKKWVIYWAENWPNMWKSCAKSRRRHRQVSRIVPTHLATHSHSSIMSHPWTSLSTLCPSNRMAILVY